MADPVSIVSGIVGLTAFAIQSSKALYDVIETVKNNSRSVRELKAELSSLVSVLDSLRDTLTLSETGMSALQSPLLRCGRLCEEFAVLIGKCSSHSDSARFSLRDSIMSTYRSKDISELRSLLAAYKSTIAIALADANIRQVQVTAKLLQQYKQTIDDTASDLQELLQRCNTRPHDPSLPHNPPTTSSDLPPSDIGEEKASIEECLDICSRVWKHIDEVYKQSFLSQSDHTKRHPHVITARCSNQAKNVTSQRLEECKTEIGFTAAQLRTSLQEANYRLAKLSKQEQSDDHESPDQHDTVSTNEEFDSIRKCLSICQEATDQVMSERINVFEDVNMADDGSADGVGHHHHIPTVSTATDIEDARESDEEFVEVDSEAGHSAEEYRDQTTMSEGSSEHWNDELEDEDDGAQQTEDNAHASTGDADDDGIDGGGGHDTPELQGHASVNVSHVLDATSVHESPLASLSAVLRSLDVHSRDAVHHARDARSGGAYAPASPEHSTSKRRSKRGNNGVATR
ncbi:hypothetical protein LTR51_008639 [Lithohypha guttulata]|nr:hypothetical protein LTR51_008639 [Lithohypha guttulata]